MHGQLPIQVNPLNAGFEMYDFLIDGQIDDDAERREIAFHLWLGLHGLLPDLVLLTLNAHSKKVAVSFSYDDGEVAIKKLSAGGYTVCLEPLTQAN